MQTACKLPNMAGAYPAAADRETSDEALIKSISNHDRRSMQVLFTRHNVKVYRFVSRFIGNPSLADDIVSEVFLDVWRQAHSFQAKSRVSTWLLAIARNKALATVRRRRLPEAEIELAAGIADTAEDPETRANGKSRNAIVAKCLERLSPAHREVIDLVYYHGKSFMEIAQIIGIPGGTVKTRMFYARRRMADLLRKAGVPGLWAC
jgi:RNA polymerase sigma-70 factor (ECF subfamily)